MRENVRGSYVCGDIEVFYRFPDGGERILLRRRNLVLYSAQDLLAKAVAGQQLINGMYMVFTNGVVPSDVIPPERRANWYQTTASAPPMGFVRVPLVGAPSFDAIEPSRYLNNIVSFTAIADNNVCVPATGNEIQDGVSKFFGVALAWLAPAFAQDVLFSAANFRDTTGADYYLKIPNAQVGTRWIVTFHPCGGGSSEGSSSL